MNKNLLFFLIFCLSISLISAQEEKEEEEVVDSLKTDLQGKGIVIDGTVVKKKINPLAPSKAAFYSAVLPGLGQIYNKRYWKVPIVYAVIGTGIYAYIYNDGQYDSFRTAFKRRRAGFTDDEYYDVGDPDPPGSEPDISITALQDAQERFQRDRDLALLVTIVIYALNIVDANVDAHLKQFNVDEDLALDIQPYLEYHPITADPNFGLALTIKF